MTLNPDKQSNIALLDTTINISTKGLEKILDTTDGQNLHWTTDINQELPIKMAASGYAHDI
jgi:hypothetical protein